jgi:type IV secretory pathway VirB2 component (pilin)
MDFFNNFLDQVITWLTTGIARGLGICALIAGILMFMFGQSGGVTKWLLTVFFGAIALANAPAIFDFLVGTS